MAVGRLQTPTPAFAAGPGRAAADPRGARRRPSCPSPDRCGLKAPAATCIARWIKSNAARGLCSRPVWPIRPARSGCRDTSPGRLPRWLGQPRSGRWPAAARTWWPAGRPDRARAPAPAADRRASNRRDMLAFHHAIDLLQFGQEIAATKFHLFARAAGTKRIGVERHC